MAAGWIELVTGSLEQKKQYRQYKARIKQLPANYRAAAEALERYLMYAGGIAKGDVAVRMYGDLVDLFEDSAANRTPIRDIVGDDPVEFVETFVANYPVRAFAEDQPVRQSSTRSAACSVRQPGAAPNIRGNIAVCGSSAMRRLPSHRFSNSS